MDTLNPPTSVVRAWLRQYTVPRRHSHIPHSSGTARGSPGTSAASGLPTSRLRSQRLHKAIGNCLTVERDDSILTDLNGVLDENLHPDVAFTPAQREKLEMMTRVAPDFVGKPNLHTLQGLNLYHRAHLFSYINAIGTFRDLFVNQIPGSEYAPDRSERNGATDWLCPGGIVKEKADTHEFHSDHVIELFRSSFPHIGDFRMFELRNGRAHHPVEDPFTHHEMLDLLEQMLCKFHSRRLRWGVALLYGLGFVVKLHASNYFKIGHILSWDRPADADSSYINTLPDISLPLMLAAIARLPSAGPDPSLFASQLG